MLSQYHCSCHSPRLLPVRVFCSFALGSDCPPQVRRESPIYMGRSYSALSGTREAYCTASFFNPAKQSLTIATNNKAVAQSTRSKETGMDELSWKRKAARHKARQRRVQMGGCTPPALLSRYRSGALSSFPVSSSWSGIYFYDGILSCHFSGWTLRVWLWLAYYISERTATTHRRNAGVGQELRWDLVDKALTVLARLRVFNWPCSADYFRR